MGSGALRPRYPFVYFPCGFTSPLVLAASSATNTSYPSSLSYGEQPAPASHGQDATGLQTPGSYDTSDGSQYLYTASAAAAAATHLPTLQGAEMAGMAAVPGNQPSALEHLHNNLAMPTKQQQNDQVFALNPEQYNALTTFEDDVDFKPPQQPSNLQQALAAMRSSGAQRGHDGRTSDVYSRSLLWDRVPEKVVRDFKRMVRECGTKNA